MTVKTAAQRFTTAVEGGRFVITEVTGQRDRCGLPAGGTRELAWQQAQEQPYPVLVATLAGPVQDLGVCWTPQAFEWAAYSGYVSAGLADTDGYYAPESFDAWVKSFRQFPEGHLGSDNHAPRHVKEGVSRYVIALHEAGLR